MAKRVLVGVLMTLILLLSSCYPELSVQQYDKLREDLEELDDQRQQLEENVASLTEVNASLTEANTSLTEANRTLRANNSITLAYIELLDELVSTQNSAKMLEGEFDVETLIGANADLIATAESLEDSQIIYFLGLMNSDNGSHIVGAYYKVIEYCVKEMKQNLE